MSYENMKYQLFKYIFRTNFKKTLSEMWGTDKFIVLDGGTGR